MKLTVPALAACLLFVPLAPAGAATATGEFVVKGAGSGSCEQYVTAVGQRTRPIMEAGKLVPDEVLIDMIAERIERAAQSKTTPCSAAG